MAGPLVQAISPIRAVAFLALMLVPGLGCARNTVIALGSSGGSAVTSSSGTASATSSASSSGSASSSSGGACSHCLVTSDCQNGICVQLGWDTYCVDSCAAAPCSQAAATCAQLTDFAGNPQEVCVPQVGSCPADSDCPVGCQATETCNTSTRTCEPAGTGSSGSSQGEICGSLIGPGLPANCTCTGGPSCGPNRCYGGWWCNTSTNYCVSPPAPGSCRASGSTSGSTGTGCAGLVAPATASTACTCTASNPSECQPNGCYGGWWCDPVATICDYPPARCSSDTGTASSGSSTGTGASSGSSGAAWTGSVTANGGRVSKLYFAAVGDTRPDNLDDTAHYPTAIIGKIFQDLASLSPPPEFVVATGDYVFASPMGTAATAQLALFIQARGAYSGPVFACLGNQECTGYTESNCGAGNPDGETSNYSAFMQQLVVPLNQAQPYYRFDVTDTGGTWTAKFLVLAMNAWTSDQAAWLQQQLQQSTTYTFIVRHEPEGTTTAPGVMPSDALISQYPYTMKIVGHVHLFSQAGARQVIVGNGGAPISGASTYGYALFEQTSTGDIQVSGIDLDSGLASSSFVVPR